MALIKCSECGHEVSDKATSCPNCGCPIADTVELTPKKSKKKWVISSVIAVAFIAICVGCWFAFDKVFPNDDPDAIVELTPEFIEKVQQYDRLAPFSEGRAAVCRGDKWGYINTKGDEVIECQFDRAEEFYEGISQVVSEDKPYYINRKGDRLFYGEGGRFSQGLAMLDDGRVVNQKGEEAFKVELYTMAYSASRVPNSSYYSEFPYFIDGVITVWGNEGQKSYDVNGKEVPLREIPDKIRRYKEFTDDVDYDSFNTGNHTGLKDENGKTVIAPQYAEISDVSNGVALVSYRENDAYFFGLDDEGMALRANDGMYETYTPRFYAYADLNGNTTFSDKDLSHIEEANEIGFQRWETMMTNQREIEYKKQELREHPERKFNEMIGGYAWRGYLKERSLGNNCEEIVCFKKSDDLQGLAFYTLWVEGSNYQSNYRVYSGMGKYQIKGNVIELKVKNPDNSFVRSYQITIGADDNVILQSHDFSNHSLLPIPFDIKLIPSNIQSFYR